MKSIRGKGCVLLWFCFVGCNGSATHNTYDSGMIDSGSDAGAEVDSGPTCMMHPPSGCDEPLDTCSTNTCDPVLLQCVREEELDNTECSVLASAADGLCVNGACCTGCIVGTTCQSGVGVPWCGSEGGSCEPCCTDPGCSCTGGHCAPLMDSMGTAQSCSIRNGQLYCWGDNTHGALGIGAMPSQSRPTLVALADVIHVSSGEGHTCALVRSGDVYCWGKNSEGQLGIEGDTSDVFTPQRISSVPKALTVSAGVNYTCAVTLDGLVYCWGNNQLGKLGRSISGTYTAIPAQVPMVTDAIDVSAGYQHTCALQRNGEVMCWGDNFYGQFGNDTVRSNGPTPKKMNFANAKQVAVGVAFTCVLRTNGAVYCTGLNSHGELGNGITTSLPVPTLVNALSNVVQISSFKTHTCAVTSAGQVHCWGLNPYYQLGSSAATGSHVIVSGLDMPVSIRAGGNFSCSRNAAGELFCWGINTHGELGDGTTDSPRATPMPVMFP